MFQLRQAKKKKYNFVLVSNAMYVGRQGSMLSIE